MAAGAATGNEAAVSLEMVAVVPFAGKGRADIEGEHVEQLLVGHLGEERFPGGGWAQDLIGELLLVAEHPVDSLLDGAAADEGVDEDVLLPSSLSWMSPPQFGHSSGNSSSAGLRLLRRPDDFRPLKRLVSEVLLPYCLENG